MKAHVPPEQMTIRDVYEEFYRQWNPDLKPISVTRHHCDIARWERLMGLVPVVEINTMHYQRFRSLTVDEKIPAATCETTVRTVKQVMRVAHAYRIVDHLPDRGRARKMEPCQPRMLTFDELERMYAATEKQTWPKNPAGAPMWWKAMLTVGIWTALRRADLLWGLSWEHVLRDENPQRIEYRACKTSKPHVYPLSPPVLAHLDALGRPLFSLRGSILGTPNNQRDVNKYMHQLSENAGVDPHATIKHLRSTSINLWRNADHDAGCILHGTGIPRVMHHYLDFLNVMTEAMPKVKLPRCMLDFGDDNRDAATGTA